MLVFVALLGGGLSLLVEREQRSLTRLVVEAEAEHAAAEENAICAPGCCGPMNRSKRDCRCYCTSSVHRWPRWRPWPVH